jgi:hypothetical protein
LKASNYLELAEVYIKVQLLFVYPEVSKMQTVANHPDNQFVLVLLENVEGLFRATTAVPKLVGLLDHLEYHPAIA